MRIKNATACTQKENFYLLLFTKEAHIHTQKLELFIQCEVATAMCSTSWIRKQRFMRQRQTKGKMFHKFHNKSACFWVLCAESSKERKFEGENFLQVNYVWICDVYWYLRYFLASHSSTAAFTKKNSPSLFVVNKKVMTKKAKLSSRHCESIWAWDKMTSIFAILQINHLL